MKSIEMEFHGFSGIGSCLSKPKGLCLGTFMHAQVVQEETYSLTNVLTPSQVYLWWMSSKVLIPEDAKSEIISIWDIDAIIQM